MEPMGEATSRNERDMQTGSERGLDALFLEYRAVVPDPEPSGAFMPQLWERIEARRNSTFLVRRWAQACVAATLALALLVTAFVLPHYQAELTRTATPAGYLDVLAAADTAADNAVVNSIEQNRGSE